MSGNVRAITPKHPNFVQTRVRLLGAKKLKGLPKEEKGWALRYKHLQISSH
jgi:hypothetical protein